MTCFKLNFLENYNACDTEISIIGKISSRSVMK